MSLVTGGQLDRAVRLVHRHRGLVLPVVTAGLIFAVLVPLPPALMDVLLAANIALAAVVLLTTLYVDSPLDFSVFPSVLLGATLIRLVLNVATTRLILTAGADGRPPAEAQFAAGRVIWAFSEFVTSGSLAVGVILFTILAIVQFVVITKGAARISEVAARFVLDAMPGKQMAIDADLNAGIIDDDEAHRRRRRVAREADFYGAMDGASKFLRGDAVAAVLITFVNVAGGMFIGLAQYDWPLDRTVELFTRLTIGDGLVAQVPAFFVSISAALIVTRSASPSRLGEQVISQLTLRPIVLVVTGVFLVALTLTALPKLPLLLLGAGCGGGAWLLWRTRREASEAMETTATTPSLAPANPRAAATPAPAQTLGTVDPLRIEMGYALVRMADPAQGGDLLERIATLRRQIGEEMGLLAPQARFVDDMSLDRQSYVIRLRGLKVASGQLYTNKLLAVFRNGRCEIAGVRTRDPATGAPAAWIARSQQDAAESLEAMLVPPPAVLTAHLGAVIRCHAADLLTRQQVAQMLEELSSHAPAVVAEARERYGAGRIQKILRGLLSESVSIRDLESVLEAACDEPEGLDVEGLTERVRLRLRRQLMQQHCDEDGRLWCVRLAPVLEDELCGTYLSEHGRRAVSPDRTQRIARAVADGVSRLTRQGRRPVLLCEAQLRPRLRRMIAPVMPELTVLGYQEVDTADVQSVGSVGIE